MLNWLSAADVDTVLRTARSAGEPGEVVARIFVCPSTETDLVRSAARRLIATYTCVPAYARFHRWLGRGELLSRTWAAGAARDRRAAAATVPDRVVDDLIVHGSTAECVRGLQRYVDASVTRPVVKLLPLDPARDPLADALALATALHASTDSGDRGEGGTPDQSETASASRASANC